MNRSLRSAPTQEAFDQREIPVTKSRKLVDDPWYRLARVEFPNQFFPSSGSRLTPDSGKFPCVYLGKSRETTVAEVWGDRFSAQREASSSPYVISASQARKWTYLRTSPLPPSLKICDLTHAATRLATGMDAAALYSPDLRVPQEWATRIANHPARFDGIHYRSRHTDEPCLVVWSRADDAEPVAAAITFEPDGDFLESDAAYTLAGKIGIRLSFAT